MDSFLETSPLHSLAQIRRDKGILPADRGLYGLFFKSVPGMTPSAGCYIRDDMHLLYIGTAGANPTKEGTLRRRLGSQHLGGNERRSTLCHTLACLLPELAGPALARSERGNIKFHTSADGVRRLQSWMDMNIAACWTIHARPAELEADLIGRYATPLNVDFSDHAFVGVLRSLRDQRRAQAIC